MKKLLVQFISEENGATAIEYGLIVASIALAIVALVFTIGDSIGETFTTISTYL